MYGQSVEEAALTGSRKYDFARSNPLGYFVAAILAGIYVGLGIVLIFAVGAPFAQADHPAIKLVMGISFGLALTLVVFAGSELYTGNVMFMTFARLNGKTSWRNLAYVWSLSWLGNLAGALALAWLVVASGSVAAAGDFIGRAGLAKTTVSPGLLVGSGILCNILVCLALWTSSRTRSDPAKILLICWCLYGFIGSGFEHSIANMTMLALAVFGGDGQGVGWTGYAYNLLWVTLGNTIGGMLLACAYTVASRPAKPAAQA